MEDVGSSVDVVTVSVKHGQHSLQVTLPASANVKELMLELQRRTEVVPRAQKLISKGKVLTGDMTLKNANITNGSKIMLMQLQGFQQGVTAAAKTPIPEKKNFPPKYPLQVSKLKKPIEKSRVDSWKATGIIPLRDSELEAVPNEVWTVGQFARILDMCTNRLVKLPEDIKWLTQLQRLRLSNNALTHENIQWQALTCLKHLTVLALDNNQLTQLPLEIGQLSKVKHLVVSNNLLKVLPNEIGDLLSLERLDLRKNCLAEIPSDLGRCTHLMEVDLSGNLLKDVPASFGYLQKLKVLVLDNNALTTIAPEILQRCTELMTLSLHGNEVTIEHLRQVEGWSEFDERRKSKYSKQIDFNIMGSSGGFDEGADAHQWNHW